jgi:hypothetical protein
MRMCVYARRAVREYQQERLSDLLSEKDAGASAAGLLRGPGAGASTAERPAAAAAAAAAQSTAA